MKDDVTEEKMEFVQEVCRKYNRTKTLAEEAEAAWRQDLEMVAESKYLAEKEMYERQEKEDLAKYNAVKEWLKLVDRAAFRVKSSKAQVVIRQHCLDGIPLKAVEFENGKHMGKTAAFYHKKVGMQQFSEELSGLKDRLQELEKKFCKN